ncbi:hypothetical protein XENTR_v10014768 [Xenopus tropicalis]|uniref:Claudin n=1 Tax=Xenopus tropicalis TaxID=8364 RepID=A0A6I8R6U1_XENTR|nr:claudin-19 isoform X1 [Xenopus tropicalis]XP_004917859.1 claudin-19 isoform X1 [Xenopus tropicalis]KAE8604636.1 hypothetical protein XENTR_v10014768 [Xenopus tropicalis]KAE8604637.1 hypothetical protein XENTR_v10014768 [Xenopus tropicalis]KAE8604638.1 hypothetical protein XENTR_v10014768 [Xenopus tropicalis]|eukprot:XP_004917858.1 PREDICTED: claudin-19-like isoform X1 [Xenopus tropicalis]
MARTSLQVCALLLAISGMTCILVSTVSTRWRVSSTAGTIITATSIFEGLWMNCIATSSGSVQCKRFSSMFSLAIHIQVCRALMIISLVLGLMSCIVSIFGLKCTKFGTSNEQTKGKIALSGGLIFILAGLLTLTAVSWYAAMITAQFFDPLYLGTKYELGSALYIGWAASLLSILGGSFLCCSFKKKKPATKAGAYKYNYQDPDSDFKQFKERKETSVASKAYV